MFTSFYILSNSSFTVMSLCDAVQHMQWRTCQ